MIDHLIDLVEAVKEDNAGMFQEAVYAMLEDGKITEDEYDRLMDWSKQ